MTTAATHENPTTTAPSSASGPRRRWLRITLAILIALALAGGGIYFWLMSGAGVQQLGEPECENADISATVASGSTTQAQQGICATMAGLTEAWGAQDAEAYGAQFTDNATYTTWVGTHHSGREDIIAGHRALFEGPLSGTQLADSFLGIELITDDVAVVTTRGDTYECAEAGELSKVQTYTMVRQDGDEWLIASFHNTQRSPLMERIQFLMVPDSKPFAER